jgi:formylglycine-generating enzyme required for sulfatase activity
MTLKTALIFLCILLVPAFAVAGPPETITAKDGKKMALIPAGKYIMGSDDDDIKDVAPLHEVYISNFYMDVHETTNEQFAKFLNEVRPPEGKDNKRWGWVVIRNDLETDERFTWWSTEIAQEDRDYVALEGHTNHPALTVSWYAADSYCKWAGKRLPTEAEWEKAARGGLKKKRFPWGDEIPTGGVIFDRLWKENLDPAPTGKVGGYYPNGYGLYDMAGNVWEWCADWFYPFYYEESPLENPKGPDMGEIKVVRGGAWYNHAMALRVAIRNTEHPMNTSDGVGFRCAKDAPGEDEKGEAKK